MVLQTTRLVSRTSFRFVDTRKETRSKQYQLSLPQLVMTENYHSLPRLLVFLSLPLCVSSCRWPIRAWIQLSLKNLRFNRSQMKWMKYWQRWCSQFCYERDLTDQYISGLDLVESSIWEVLKQILGKLGTLKTILVLIPATPPSAMCVWFAWHVTLHKFVSIDWLTNPHILNFRVSCVMLTNIFFSFNEFLIKRQHEYLQIIWR